MRNIRISAGWKVSAESCFMLAQPFRFIVSARLNLAPAAAEEKN